MIKVKSKSKDLKEHHDFYNRYTTYNKKNDSKSIKTVENRNHSNEYISPYIHHPENYNSNKIREISSSKNQRKQSKYYDLETNHFKVGVPDSKDIKRNHTFIGTKLKKKLQKYLLFLSFVNYSLRISYKRAQSKKFRLFVGKGNNSKLVKKIILNRFWWSLTQNEAEANLIWTQKSRKSVFESIQNFDKSRNKQQEAYETDFKKIRQSRHKKKELKKHDDEDEFQLILANKDRQILKRQCRHDFFLEDLKIFLKKTKNSKRNNITITHNHIQNHRLLTNKKNLFYNIQQYCTIQKLNLFQFVPLTFHVKECQQAYNLIQKCQQSIQDKKQREKLMWIVKPGQNSNRGCGIEVFKKKDQVSKYIQRQKNKHPERTFIVQKYIIPFLFHRRKFDIRCFVLVTATPFISAYFYPNGYIRTSSYQFNLKNCSNKFIHLTNDAIQKKAAQYSKFESGNKVTFQEFQKYLDLFEQSHHYSFFTTIIPRIRQLITLSIKSTKNFDSSNKQHTFEILGYDFMIDENFLPWLIQINTNPCLQTGCDVLNDIIPSMLENAIKIAVDPIFKPPKIDEWPLNELLTCEQKILEPNKFELIYKQDH